MLLIWTVYAQLFFLTWRRSRLQLLVISVTTTRDAAAECIVCNMAQEICFIEAIAISPTGQDNEGKTVFLNDLQPKGSGDDREEAGLASTQGPLGSGEVLNLGSVNQLLHKTRDVSRSEDKAYEEFQIRIIAYYGVRRQPFAAVRKFKRREGGRGRIVPTALTTDQMHSRSERREVRRWLDEFYGGKD